MVSETILDMARQGDPKVIAALINRLVKPKGIMARATKQNQCLHVLLESPHRLNQQATTTLIHQLIEQCQVATINQLTIYARQAGSQAIAWRQDIVLLAAPHSPVTQLEDASTDWSASPSIATSDAPVTDAPVIDLRVTDAPEPPSDPHEVLVDGLWTPSVDGDLVSSDNNLHPAPSVDGDLVSSDNDLHPISIPMAEESIPPADSDLEADAVSDETEVVDPGLSFGTEPDDEEAEPVIDLEIFSPEVADAQRWDMLKRPEAALLIVFALIVALWDIYLALIEEPASSHPLTAQELARRLGIHSSTLKRRKDRLDFSEWTQDLDPEGLAWVYQNGVYVPQPHAGDLVDL